MKTNQTIVKLAVTSLFALQMTASLQAETQVRTVGDSRFGATLTGTFDHAAWQDHYQLYMAGSADAKILSKTLKLASGESTILAVEPNHAYAWGNLKAGGYTLISWNKYFVASTNFRTMPFFSAQIGGEGTFPVGPGSVKVNGSASLLIWAEGDAAIGTGAGGTPVLRASIGPVADAAAYGSVAYGFPGCYIGIEGTLKLCGIKATGAVDIYQYDGCDTPCVYYAATFNTGAPSGKLAVFAEIGIWPLSTRPSYTIYQDTGKSANYALASGSFWLP